MYNIYICNVFFWRTVGVYVRNLLDGNRKKNELQRRPPWTGIIFRSSTAGILYIMYILHIIYIFFTLSVLFFSKDETSAYARITWCGAQSQLSWFCLLFKWLKAAQKWCFFPSCSYTHVYVFVALCLYFIQEHIVIEGTCRARGLNHQSTVYTIFPPNFDINNLAPLEIPRPTDAGKEKTGGQQGEGAKPTEDILTDSTEASEEKAAPKTALQLDFEKRAGVSNVLLSIKIR